MADYEFTPPTVSEAPAGGARPFDSYKLDRGVSILVTDGVVTQKRFPSQEEVDAADYVYLGGHKHLISTAEADVLTAAGYTPTVYDPLGD